MSIAGLCQELVQIHSAASALVRAAEDVRLKPSVRPSIPGTGENEPVPYVCLFTRRWRRRPGADCGTTAAGASLASALGEREVTHAPARLNRGPLASALQGARERASSTDTLE